MCVCVCGVCVGVGVGGCGCGCVSIKIYIYTILYHLQYIVVLFAGGISYVWLTVSTTE